MDKSEQWRLKGYCKLCRRRPYCTKECTAKKKHTKEKLIETIEELIGRKKLHNYFK